MLKDFGKIDTFLTAVKEKSFSKASKKLGISQPAVTQQIKLLEEYFDTKIVDRKKNGIKLTKEGEDIYRIVTKMEKCINSAEREIIRVMNKQFTFVLGASFTIGNYMLPDCLNEIKDAIKNDVLMKVDVSKAILDQLEDKKLDIALIENPDFRETMNYREWVDDELVLFSNTPLPKVTKKEDLYNFHWICREEDSHTRKLVSESFESIDVECKNFDVRSVVTSSTAVKNSILKSEVNTEHPTVSIISRYVIEDDVKSGLLHETKIKGVAFKRTLYLAYLKERKNDAFIDSVIRYIMSKRKI
jgi:DNA-binding transcriptional LysR family regulator